MFGGLATYALWRQLERKSGEIDRHYVLLAVAWLRIAAPLLSLVGSTDMR